ncbi:hypothetical protein ABLE92_22355 [Gordonia sp. VNQ95]|uniref:hypothetical protein n=1 Tax=Gordonia sp. VNQ95 TaxID=3156619 RepID=UPI0032B60C51
MQIRDIDDEVYAALSRRAAEDGITVPELLRREATKIATRPSIAEWLRRTGRRPSQIRTEDVLTDLDKWRGEWPDARR